MKKGNKNNLKDRYCKLCGGKINNLKQCSKCGKQYFRLKFEYGLYFIIAILLITIACLVFLFVQKDEDLKQANANAINWQKKHENMTSMYATLEKRFDELDDGKVIGHHGNGNYYISIYNEDEIDRVIPFIKQSLEINKK